MFKQTLFAVLVVGVALGVYIYVHGTGGGGADFDRITGPAVVESGGGTED